MSWKSSKSNCYISQWSELHDIIRCLQKVQSSRTPSLEGVEAADGTVTSEATAKVNTITAPLQQDDRKHGTVFLFFRFYSRRDDTDLAGALGAAVHRPFTVVLVHDAVVDADSTLVHLILQQRAFLRLRAREGREREEKELIRRMENFHFAKVPVQMIC